MSGRRPTAQVPPAPPPLRGWTPAHPGRASSAAPAPRPSVRSCARSASARVEAADQVREEVQAVLGRGGRRDRRRGGWDEEGRLLRVNLPAQPLAACAPPGAVSVGLWRPRSSNGTGDEISAEDSARRNI
jgi:hypothetical protein